MVWQCRDHAGMSNHGACWCDHADGYPLPITPPGRPDPDRGKRALMTRRRMRAGTLQTRTS
jgi:hypothetical protein